MKTNPFDIINFDCMNHIISFCDLADNSAFMKTNYYMYNNVSIDWEIHLEKLIAHYPLFSKGLKRLKTHRMKCMHIVYEILILKYELTNIEGTFLKKLHSKIRTLERREHGTECTTKRQLQALMEKESCEHMVHMLEKKRDKIHSYKFQCPENVFKEYHDFNNGIYTEQQNKLKAKGELLLEYFMSNEFAQLSQEHIPFLPVDYIKSGFGKYAKTQNKRFSNIDCYITRNASTYWKTKLILTHQLHNDSINKARKCPHLGNRFKIEYCGHLVMNIEVMYDHSQGRWIQVIPTLN